MTVLPEPPLRPRPRCPHLQAIAEHLQLRPDLFPAILSTLFEIVLFEDCSNQWSLSRPMLSLILVNEQIYAQLRWAWFVNDDSSSLSPLHADPHPGQVAAVPPSYS